MDSCPPPYTFFCPDLPIRWEQLTPDRLAGDVALALERSRENLEAIAAIDPADATFSSVVLALEEATRPLDTAWSRAEHLNAVANGEEFRAAHRPVQEKVVLFYASIPLDGRLWELVRAVSRRGEELSPVDRRLLEKTLRDFVDGGAELDPAGKDRLREIRGQLARTTQKFSENVLDALDFWEKYATGGEELEGMPETVLTVMRSDAEAHGHPGEWRLSLHEPILVPALRYLESEPLRRELWEASSRVGQDEPFANGPLIQSILQLRREEAQLLGHANFADLVLSRRMARSGANALQFTENLHRRIGEAFRRAVEQLERFRARSLGRPVEPLEPWDVAYWEERMGRAQLHFDGEELRPYLELDAVLRGLFAIAHRLYGVRAVERKTVPAGGTIPVWHGSVRYFELWDGDGTSLGSFYLDLHPRTGKRSGAWMDDGFAAGYRDREGNWHRPMGIIAANLTPPGEDRPSLLTHREVETLFHEFGHLLHHLFGRVERESLNGTRVFWDFVELPSQFLENWTWERKALDLFARHYLDAGPIPEELFQRLSASRTFLSALAFMRQLGQQKMDLDLHLSYDGSDLDAFVDRSLEGYRMPLRTKPPTILRRFLHLFADPVGYAAAYYSYKWAEVLEADAFDCFLRRGIFDRESAGRFRREILETGNGAAPEELFRNFRGRDPKLEPLLRRERLLETQGGRPKAADRQLKAKRSGKKPDRLPR
ncbi:MAG: M3 family metallopeptidase [Puniceicoccales bacterium]|jgi:oligopeptidase A|nr:M3 family metallopeptidase [Puniceicoccales bacterium]